MNTARRLTGAILLSLCAALTALALAGTPALALKTHLLSGSIGGPGSGKGQFDDPVAVAVNDSTELGNKLASDVYVVDNDSGGTSRVERFSATGAYLGQFNGSGAFEVEGKSKTGAPAPTGQIGHVDEAAAIAVDSSGDVLDPSSGDVYVFDEAHNVIDKFSATGEYEGQLEGVCESPGACPGAATPFFRPFAIAVDSAGDLWVAEGQAVSFTGNFISEFSDTGNFIKRLHITRGTKLLNGNDQQVIFGRSEDGLAVDQSDNLYEATSEGPIKVNSSSGVAEYDWTYINGAYESNGSNSPLYRGVIGLAYNPSTDGLLFADYDGEISEYSLEGEPTATPLATFGAGYFTGWRPTVTGYGGEAPEDVAVSSAGAVYATEPKSNRVLFFDEVVLPGISASTASDVTETTATLGAVVSPSGQAVTGCGFEYVSDAAHKEHFADEVQSIELSATGGDFTLTFESATTAPIPYDASAGEVGSALAAISSVGVAGNVEVTGGNGGPYKVEFKGVFADKNVPQLTVDSAALAPPGAATVTTTIEGGDGWETAAIGACSPEASKIPEGSGEVPVSASVAGLSPDTTYDFRLRVEDASGANTGEVGSFTTLSPLIVGGDSFSGVGAGSVTLAAEINPGGSTGEYDCEEGAGAGAEYGAMTPRTEVEHGHGTVYVHTQVSGLEPGKAYHFRVVASDEEGSVQEGVDVSFSTFPAVVGGLPDSRVYEMVTPVENDEANVNLLAGWPATVGPTTEGRPYRAAVDGEAVAYESAPTVGGNGNNGNAIVATRSAAGGWTQLDVQPQGIPFAASFASFSSDVTSGVVASETPLVPGGPGSAGVTAFYLWRAGIAGYQALPGQYAGESSDGNDQLMEESGRLYEVADDAASPVGVLPGGQLAGASSLPTASLSPRTASHGWISADGSRVIWVSGEGALYMRDMTSGETVQLDRAQGGSASGGGMLWTASAEGSRVFFTDEQQLTSDSTATGGAPDLYECEMVQDAGKLACELRDLTVHGGESANVRGVLGASENGAYVYFVATGALASGASGQECNPYEASGCNLYVSHNGDTAFIATLSSQESEDASNWANPGSTAEVSASGSLVFISNQSLTGYDNTGQACAEPVVNVNVPGPCNEVYVYDPDGGGHIFCVSCSPSGEPPAGSKATESYLPSDGTEQTRWISEDGNRVFFDTGERLVARDTNGLQDVYEWERDGSGSCETEPGCVYLLSSGSGTSSSYLLDASANGDDVFIVSRDPLVQAGQGNDYALYDARVDGVKPVSPPACTGTGCQGIPAAPPTFATPASATFNGVGNFLPPTPAAGKPKAKAKALTRTEKLAKALRACRPQQKRKRASCETRARRRYGAKSKAAKSAKGRN